MESATIKEEELIRRLKQYSSIAIAFSGGVDSTYLLAVARECLQDKVIALTAQSPIHSLRERESALKIASDLGVRQIFVTTSPLSVAAFSENTSKRCYHCKKHLFDRLWGRARELGVNTLAHGANLDDCGDYRPGSLAAVELNVHAPLMDAGMTKSDIRQLSRKRGLSTWNKPAMACLATRIPYGQSITSPILEMIAAAEDLLYNLGFEGCRVRWHGEIARIEAPEEMMAELLRPAHRRALWEGMQKIGFLFTTLDLQGYVQGSMNRMLGERDEPKKSN